MDTNKYYKSYSIPEREQLEEIRMDNTQYYTGTSFEESDAEPFVEIEINQLNSNLNTTPIPSAQSVTPVMDEIRTLFYSMRQIARDNFSFYNDGSKIFYQQALFMKDFEDDYTKEEPFSAYYPYYQMMNYGQLRTYFTWRAKVRKGDITNTSVAYAFLYIYELLNNIGVTNPEDGLEKLMSFWQAFRDYNTIIDEYVLQWIKHYHIYYPLKQSFQEFAKNYHLQMYYPTVFGYESGQNDSFDLFADISKYNIKKSIFYNEQTQEMIHNCFYFILKHLREIFKEKKKCFEDYIFCPLARESIWMPFSKALFYPALKQSDRQVVISEREVYSCESNHWTYTTVILSEPGRQFLGYIMKEMESMLRKSVKFKHKLFANPDVCDSRTRNKLVAMGISLPRIIKESVLVFYSQYTRKIITVDIKNIKQIREDALNTQEKLIVQEEMEIGKKIEIDVKKMELGEKKTEIVGKKIEIDDKELELDGKKTEIGGIKIEIDDKEMEFGEKKPEIGEIKIEQKTSMVAPPASDIWAQFKESLTPIELQALKLVLQKQDVIGFAIRNNIMLEVLADGINQKAMDCLGDTVLELEDEMILYDDYREKITEMVKN